tara:strand:- start:1423 stop:1632 length:210 start_codon:yes stop_codon:yes gene_type:complete
MIKDINLEVNDGRLIHIWTAFPSKIMVSFEDTKTLTSFSSVDSAINWLYLAGYKLTARKLNKLNSEVTQ